MEPQEKTAWKWITHLGISFLLNCLVHHIFPFYWRVQETKATVMQSCMTVTLSLCKSDRYTIRLLIWLYIFSFVYFPLHMWTSEILSYCLTKERTCVKRIHWFSMSSPLAALCSDFTKSKGWQKVYTKCSSVTSACHQSLTGPTA